MAKKLTLSMNEAVIDAAKEYASNQGTSLSSLVENLLKRVTGTVSINKDPAVKSETPITDRIREIHKKHKLSSEEVKKQQEEWFKRKPYMREVMEHLEKKHG